MGRIADALARAETRRLGDRSADRAPVCALTRRWSNWYGAASAVDFGTDDVAEPSTAAASRVARDVVTYSDRSSVISEQFRSLRTRLLSTNPRQEHRLFGITSALPREGKSVTTVNLGFCLAEVRHLRVLLVDADFRHSSLAGLVGVDDEPGLADYLRNEAEYDQIVRRTVLPNLSAVSAGRTRGRPAPELLSTRRARSVFRRFGKEFQYVLVDTPPAASVADAGIVGQMTHGMVFVIRMHHTHEPLARRAVKLLTANNVPIIGSVVIGEDHVLAGYGRRYQYERYYGYATSSSA